MGARKDDHRRLSSFFKKISLLSYNPVVPMTDSNRRTRERSLSPGDFDVTLFRYPLPHEDRPHPSSPYSPTSSHHKTHIISTMLQRVNLGGRKTRSESNGQYAYVHRLTRHSSQAARRDQNRIAQREFRLRKQQRVMPPSLLQCRIRRIITIPSCPCR